MGTTVSIYPPFLSDEGVSLAVYLTLQRRLNIRAGAYSAVYYVYRYRGTYGIVNGLP
jgi:hypothetical protein